MGNPSLLTAARLELPLASPALRGSLLFYGIYDLERAWALAGATVRTPIRSLLGAEPAAAPELARLASPLRHVAPGLPPVFLCAGEKDALAAESIALARALERAGVACTSLVLGRREHPDAGHSFLNFGARAATQAALRAALAFADRARA
jgi:acetyl esterase/lipase